MHMKGKRMEEKKFEDDTLKDEETLKQDIKREEESDTPLENDDKETDEVLEETEEVNEISDKTEEAFETDSQKEDKKKKKNSKKKDPKDEKIQELNDKYQRLFAEFQNYRNRSEKEKNTMFDMGARNIIEKILPMIDNFERGIAALSEDDLNSPVGQGMDLIYKQMKKTLEDIGVESIEAEGKEFDPQLHNAVMQVENEELEENIVAQELQKGYTYKGAVIRHSMVSVVTK